MTSVAVHHTQRTSLGVRQRRHDVCGCLWLPVSTHMTSMAVRVCQSAHTGGRPWLSISTHISTLALPVDCSGDFGPSGLSVQYTQDVHGCPSAHIGRPCVSVSTHLTPVAVRVCPFVSISTHRMYVAVHKYTYQHVGPWTQHADPSHGQWGTSVAVRVCPYVSVCVCQHTQDVYGCPSVHISARCTHRTSVGVRQHTQDVHWCPWLSVSTHRTSVAVCVCPSAHTGRSWLSISTHISTLVLGLSTLALPVDCSGDFGPRGLSVQYTHDVCGCPSAHTGHMCASVSTHRTSVAVRVCLCVSVSTNRMSVAVHQYTYQHVGPWTQHTDPSRGLFGTHMTSVAVRVCLCVSISTHRMSVAVHQYTYQHVGPWTQHIDPSRGLFGTSVCVRQYTHDARGCPWLSVCVRVCPSAHTGCPWLSISTHISTLVLGLSMLTLPVDWSGDFGPLGLSVQYTQDVRGCPPAQTGRVWLSVAVRQHTQDVRGCLCVSISTHMTSVAVHQYTYQHYTQDVRGCPPAHPGRPCVSVSTHMTSVVVRGCLCVSVSIHMTSLAVHHTQRTSMGVRQHTQDVCGCSWLSVSTHRTSVAVRVCLCVSVCVRQHKHDVRGCPSVHISARCPFPWTVWLILAHVGCLFSTQRTYVGVRQHIHDVCGCPWLPVSTHMTSMAVRVCQSAHTRRPWLSISTHISTLALPVDCSGDFGPSGLSVQYTQDVHGFPSAHTGRPCVSVSTPMTSVAVRVCLFVSISTHRMYVAIHKYTYQHLGPWTQHADPSHGLCGTSMAVLVCPCVSVCVRQHTQDVFGCPSVHISARWSLDSARWPFPWTVWVILAHVGCLFSTHMTSVGVRQHTQDVHWCPWLSVSTHRTSVAVCVCPSAHTGCPWLSISTHISTLVLGLSTLALPVDCSGDFGPRGLSVQYTHDVRGCPSAHTGHMCASVSTHRTSVAVRVCLCVSVSTNRTSVAVHQYTYQHVVHTERPWVSASTHRTSVAVRGDPSAHTGRPWLSVCVCVCRCVSVSTHMTSVAVHHTQRTSMGVRQHTQDVCGCSWLSVSTHRTSVAVRVCLCVSVCVRQHKHDVRGCPSVHISARCPFPWTVWLILAHVGCLFSTQRTYVGVRQHIHDVCGCPWLPVSTHMTSMAVRVCQSAHTRRPWLSISTHISTLALPVDCSGDFGPSGLSVQYTQDVHGFPSAHTGRPCVSVSTPMTSVAVRVCLFVSISTHRMYVAIHKYTYQDLGPWTQHADPSHGLCGTSVAVLVCPCVSVCVRQHTQDVFGCPSVHISARWSLDSARWPFPWTVWVILAHVGCLFSTHMTSVGVRQHTQDVHWCPWLSVSTHRTSVAVCVCPSAHTGCPWLSISTHISTLVLGLSTLALPVDCSGDFGPRGLSVQYTHDVRGCPSAHTGHMCASVSTHRTSVAVRVCLCVSVSTNRTSVAVHQYTYQHVVHTERPWVSASTHRTSMAVRGDPSAHTGRPWLSVCVCVCRCVSVSTHMTSVAVHQYTYHHAVPSRGLFGCYWPTWAVCSVHKGRPWVSASTHRTCVAVRGCPLAHRTSVAVRVCQSAHTGRPWLSVCVSQHTHISTLVLGLSMLALPVDCSGDFGPSGLSVQYTQDVRGCPSGHTGCPCVSGSTHRMCVAVHHTHRTSVGVRQHIHHVCGCPWLPVSTHMTSMAVRVCQSAHTRRPWLSISTHISTLALPVDCSGDFGPSGLSVQYTQDVHGFPSAHTGRPCVSVSTPMTSVAVRVCLFVSISTHRMYVAIHKYTYQHVGPWTQHADPSHGLCGTSVAVRVCPCVSVCVRQHTQDVYGCPSVHISARWSLDSARWPFPWTVWVILAHVGCLFSTHMTSVGVRQHTQDVHWCPWLSVSTHRTSVAVCVCPSAHTGCPWVSASTHRTSVCVRQYTHDARGCPWLSVAVCVCPCVSISTHRMSVAVHQYTYQHYTPDVSGCPPAHTGRPLVSVAVRQHTQDVRGCLCVSISTHMTSVAVHQYTYQHAGPWTQHAGHSCGLFGTHITTLSLPVDCLVDIGPRGLSVQYTKDVRGCPPAHTGRLWLSVAIRQHTQDVCGCLCVSVSVRVCPTQRTSLGVRQRRHDVCGCLWLPVSTHMTSMAVRVCQSAHTGGRPWLSISTHISTLALPVDCSGDFGPSGLSVQYTQDVHGCPSAHIGRPCVSVSTHLTSVAVRVCPFVSISTHRMYVAVHKYTYQHVGPWTQHADPSHGQWGTHISTLVLGLSTLALPVDCLGDFGPRGLSVQYTQDVRGCPPAHTGRPLVSVAVRQHTQDVRGCLCVSISTHRTSVAVHQYTYQHAGPWTQHAGPSCGLFGTYVCVRQHTQDVCGCPCVSVCVRQHKQDVCGCPSVHITLVLGLSILTLPVDCLGDFGPRGLSVQYTQNVCGCPPAHTGRLCVSVSTHMTSVAVRVCPCVSISTHRMSVAVHPYTYQHVGPWTQHIDPSRGLFGTSVCVRQYTHDARGCPWLSVCVRVCPSAHTGCPWLPISTHISTLVLGLSMLTLPVDCTLTLPVDCSGDFGPRGLSVQYTQDVCGCPPAHIGRLWLSLCVRVYPSVSVSTHRTSLAVHQYTYQHVGPWTQHAGPSRGLFG
ncbi:hypothetical protein YC2023_066390 [Brassica napus]